MSTFEFSNIPAQVDPVKTKFRCIQTQIPVPESLPILDSLYRNEPRSMHGQMPIVWDRAKDFQVFDAWGNCWIDFTSTIFVANAGHANDAIIKAIQNTLGQGLLQTYTYASKVRADFVEYLIAHTPDEFEKAYLVSAGTEAAETVIKLMRLYGQHKAKRRSGIIVFDGSFHGRTMGAAQISGAQATRQWMGFEDPNIFRLPFPYPWDDDENIVTQNGHERFESDLKRLQAQGVDLAQDVSGIVFESYIGWAAAFFPKDYVQAWSKYAAEHDFLVAFDEIQSGFGRTGRLFAYQHYELTPDLICCGKGISSSLPLAAVLGRCGVMDLPDVGSMSSTHSANPTSCAAGLANFQEIQRLDLVEQARQKGEQLHQFLNALKNEFPDHISHVLGKGLLAAILFKGENGSMLASHICENALHKGLLLVHTGRESIKIGPPLTIPIQAMLEGLAVLKQVIAQTIKGTSP